MPYKLKDKPIQEVCHDICEHGLQVEYSDVCKIYVVVHGGTPGVYTDNDTFYRAKNGDIYNNEPYIGRVVASSFNTVAEALYFVRSNADCEPSSPTYQKLFKPIENQLELLRPSYDRNKIYLRLRRAKIPGTEEFAHYVTINDADVLVHVKPSIYRQNNYRYGNAVKTESASNEACSEEEFPKQHHYYPSHQLATQCPTDDEEDLMSQTMGSDYVASMPSRTPSKRKIETEHPSAPVKKRVKITTLPVQTRTGRKLVFTDGSDSEGVPDTSSEEDHVHEYRDGADGPVVTNWLEKKAKSSKTLKQPNRKKPAKLEITYTKSSTQDSSLAQKVTSQPSEPNQSSVGVTTRSKGARKEASSSNGGTSRPSGTSDKKESTRVGERVSSPAVPSSGQNNNKEEKKESS